MNKKIFILDSNVFIGALFVDDSLHNEAIEVFEEIQNDKIIVPYCVVQEVCSIFAYRFGKQKADHFLEFILSSENIELVNNDVHDEIVFFRQFKNKISFTDLSLLYLANKYNATLVTFDQQLLKLYGKEI